MSKAPVKPLVSEPGTMGFDFNARQLVAGVDEVGRGPLVGNVVAAAVILDPDNPIDGLTDSKKLSEKSVKCCFH